MTLVYTVAFEKNNDRYNMFADHVPTHEKDNRRDHDQDVFVGLFSYVELAGRV